MNFGVKQELDWNTLSDDDFRQRVRVFLEENYPEDFRHVQRRLRWTENGGWFRQVAKKGWLAPNWPLEFGGLGLAPAKQLIFLDEHERIGVGRYADHGIHMVGPVLIKWGTPEQQEKYLPRILDCEHRWCQGYSEPNAGSDLASLRTSAVVDGDSYVINGHKIWTSMAQDCTHIYVLAKTDPSVKKQVGISFFLVNLDQPGITVRPIKNLAGEEEFCEVFFDNVRTHSSNLVGGLNNGWTVAKSLLGFERIFIGSPKLPENALQQLTRLAEKQGLANNPVFQDKYIQLQLDVEHLSAIYQKYAQIATSGGALGSDVSMLKIWATETYQRIADLLLETAGPTAALLPGDDIGESAGNVLSAYYNARLPTIYSGTNEIQRDIIAKQVLNLPA
ncbi:acyl-CoA dehydrogenase [Pollutimonas nitritireducens]|uniref:Acyl-CoA dehydrogenase n=1 Tax=Pollutimonas nitritireducens TaxID=2045209 RepID=A0A2N4UE43_9BURK|nr:acyl-CoA dehydrogenase family protein [Pollutimonas nitritireducens]PLC53293.1 acyl-CoA dehydrogenase [Pollutimonas nitritireducens]